MGESYYEAELSHLSASFSAALNADIDDLQSAIASAAESSIIGVGSGGSYTVASLLCNLHESFTGRVSRPSTPLEIICNPTLAASSPVFIISAEGKNPDVIEALERARRYSSRSIHVVTNRDSSPLMTHVRELPEVTPHVFELAKKDGYLATNSLLLDAVIIARAYGALASKREQFPSSLDSLRIGDCSISEWLNKIEGFVTNAVTRKGLIVVFSPLLRPIAADLESKLSESALLYCQLADVRSFAHGRHLWLAERPDDCAILALIEPGLSNLWRHMEDLLPKDVPVCTMPFGGARPTDLVAGLVAQMQLISLIARELKKDPAKPHVPQFGRELYYIDLPTLIPRPNDSGKRGLQSKYDVLGARWPSKSNNGVMARALEIFEIAIQKQKFRAIVFDYDGTLCSSQSKDAPPASAIVERLIQLVKAGIVVGVASGRGDSVQEHLQASVPSEYWSQIHLGLYNGGWIGFLDESIPSQTGTNEFLSHVRRILGRLENLGVPILKVRENYPHQISVRFNDGVDTASMWFVVADALRQAGLDFSTIVRSKHSVDILGVNVNKAHLVAKIVQHCRIDPYQIITMGDQGAWPGNDASLLEHRYSLSVDQPSRRLDRGWKLAPDFKRDVDATLWYLERAELDCTSNQFQFLLDK